jgi:dihydrolipoamide dehydrogenase
VRMRINDGRGKEEVIEAEVLLVAIGRQGNVEDIGLETVGVATEDGLIPVDAMMRTNVPNIYAIGDVNGQQMLAHTAMHMGTIAVEHIAGQNPYPLDVLNSPMVTFCRPEIASVGLTEKQAIEQGRTVKTGKFPMRPNGKAVIEGETEGFAKIVADGETNDMLGLTIVGPHATELIGGLGMGRLLEVTPEEVGISVFPHPTVSEVIHEAALDLLGHALHI